MPHSINIERPSPPRARVLAAAALLSFALPIAGCGGSSSPSVAHLSSAKAVSSANSEGSDSSAESKASGEQALIAFAACMRSSGVPNFPDPEPGGGFHLAAGTNPSSPVFKAAQAKCQKLLPGGLPGAGATTHPSAQTMARMLKISRCIRQHGVSGFPDPTTSTPSKTGGAPGVIADREGAIFVLPATIMQSPAFTRAASACGFPLHNH